MKDPHPIAARVAPDNPLFETIEAAYRLFTRPKPKITGVCEQCCMDRAIEKDFFNPSINELPLTYVRDWYSAAYDPKGVPKETWAYLLPRLLEILAADEPVSHAGIEVSLNRFQTGDPANWSGEEWKILDDFQRTYLALRTEQGDEPLDSLLCMFSLAGWQLPDLLKQVSSNTDAILAQRFWKDWCKDRCAGRAEICITAFWESPGNAAAYDFYTSQDLYERMSALALADNTDLAEKAFAVAAAIAATY